MIAICPNPFRDAELNITRQAVKLLNEAGFETAVCPVFAEENDPVIPEKMETQRLGDVARDCTLIIVIGGDGTILAASRQIKGLDVPLLGVNLGTKGFMTTLEPEDIGLIVKAAKGEYRISKRMMLDVSLIRDGRAIYTDYALNDAVVHGYGDCVKISAWCDGERITGFSGDGVIISTATGSTGYSMSAGGPIVEPEADAMRPYDERQILCAGPGTPDQRESGKASRTQGLSFRGRKFGDRPCKRRHACGGKV